MPAWCTLKEEPQFWFRPTRADAVDVSFNHGDAVSSGLGYAELERCSVQTHKASRRRVIPSWALNPATLQTVLVAFWEARAYGNGCHIKPQEQSDLSLQGRLKRAQRKLEQRARNHVLPMLDALCRRFVESSDPQERERLTQRIRSADMQLRVIKAGPGLALRVWNAAYSRGLDSVGVAQEVKVSSVLVRQILHRANKTWRRIQAQDVQKVNGCASPKPKNTRVTTPVAAGLPGIPLANRRLKIQTLKALRH
jgi:hypothetical protein